MKQLMIRLIALSSIASALAAFAGEFRAW